jgi:hypothetical protein
MLKRKISDYDASDSSMFGDVPVRTKRLYRRKNSDKQQWAPQPETTMSELLDFVLQHEEAFKKCAFLAFCQYSANMCKSRAPCVFVRGLPAAARDQRRWLPRQHRSVDESLD